MSLVQYVYNQVNSARLKNISRLSRTLDPETEIEILNQDPYNIKQEIVEVKRSFARQRTGTTEAADSQVPNGQNTADILKKEEPDDQKSKEMVST